MANSVIVFDEPDLEFRYEQRLIDPRDGLALFGPYDADSSSQPGTLTYTVIRTSEGIAKFSSWASRMNSPTVEEINRNHLLWPLFLDLKLHSILSGQKNLFGHIQ
ncbi:MAG: hypothetical protein R2867_04350 [Caldilineaceae bacterium]